MPFIKDRVARIKAFLTTDIWTIDLADVPRYRAVPLKALRILVVAVRGFQEDQCNLRAGSLTFFSLLSIVPVLAMAFGIAKGFGLDEFLERTLTNLFKTHEEILQRSLEFANSLLDTTRGGMVAGVGLIILFYSVMKLLMNVENAFNTVWGVSKSRHFIRKFTDYVSLMLIIPIVIIISGSGTLFISTRVMGFAQQYQELSVISPFLIFLFKLIPYILVGFMLTMLYLIMPNTSVSFKAAFIAGLVAGIMYQGLQWGYVSFQIGVSRYNAIYGSFAALPLFLIWLQISWFVVLFGAEIAFALQHVRRYENSKDITRLSQSFIHLLSLQVVRFIVGRVVASKQAPSAAEIAVELGFPENITEQLLDKLCRCNIVAKALLPGKDDFYYLPATDIAQLSVRRVTRALENDGDDDIPIRLNAEIVLLAELLETFNESAERSPANQLLRDI